MIPEYVKNKQINIYSNKMFNIDDYVNDAKKKIEI